MEKLATRNDNNMLDDGELFQIAVDLAAVNTAAATADEKVVAYSTFTLEIKPPDGAVLIIERTVPASVGALVNLY